MFTVLDHTLAYGRREALAREVTSGRLENELRTTRDHRPGGWWVLRLVRALRASSNRHARAGSV